MKRKEKLKFIPEGSWKLIRITYSHYRCGKNNEVMIIATNKRGEEPQETLYMLVKDFQKIFGEDVFFLRSFYVFGKYLYAQSWWDEDTKPASNTIIKIGDEWRKLQNEERWRVEFLGTSGFINGINMVIFHKKSRKIHEVITISR